MSRGNRSQSGHKRTAEERDRDRVERERRRAGRSGSESPEAGVGAPHAEPAAAPPPEPAAAAAAAPLGDVAFEEFATSDLDPAGTVEPRAARGAEPDDDTLHDDSPHDDVIHANALHDDALHDDALHDDDELGDDPPHAHQGEPLAHDDEPYAQEDALLDGDAAEAQKPQLIPTDPYAKLDPLPPQGPSRGPVAGGGAGAGVAPAAGAGGAAASGSGRRGARSGRVRRTGAAEGTGGGGRGGRGAGTAGGRRRFTRARVAALFALAVAIALVWFLLSLFQPFAGGGTGRVIVQIPKGSSSSKIGSILVRDHVVSSGFFFDIRALLEGKRSSLHSGRFQLKREMSYSAAIEALSKPPPKVIAVKVVIPEGYTRRQIADLVGEDALSGSYLAATVRSRILNPRHYGAPGGTRNLEGFLFPATYELTAGAAAQRLVDEQLRAFRARFTAEDMRRARELHVTPYELLTVASMIEREAQTEHDRPRIAAVIYNRLKEGIPLGIDATIYYAVELQKGIATYTGELTESQLKIDSPYNSRTHKGLPPTPISNPGEASINAAAHPSHVPYLYYVAGADGCGEQVFSKTYAEFEKNVAAYDAAVKKNGGHPPACKKK